ncbi:MAG: winged helix-turn-helix transcriptional regulator, partial [Thermoplasmata archaeon]
SAEEGPVHGPEGGTLPTIFIGPDRVPVAVYYDDQGQMRLSQLSLTGQVKSGVVLSNLPPTSPVRDDWLVDVVAMDANGLLHVVWTQGDGVWHKAYDIDGNVKMANHRLSATEATAHSPAIAATDSTDGTIAWVTWTETRDSIGTHVRLASLDSVGMVIDSTYVDDWTQRLEPTVSDVASGLDGEAYVTFMAADGAYWAVPDGDGGHDLHLVHGPDDGSMPSTILHSQGTPNVIWRSGQGLEWDYILVPLLDGSLGEPMTLENMAGLGDQSFRPSDILTVTNGGPAGTISLNDGYLMLMPIINGGFDLDGKGLYVEAMVHGADHIIAITDDRGQTYLGWYEAVTDSSVFRVIGRASDTRLSSIMAQGPVLIRSGTDLDLTVTVENLVGYDADVVLGVKSSSSPPFMAEISGDEVIMLNGGESATVTVRVTASMTAVPGTTGTITVSSSPKGWPDISTDLDFTVEIPEYKPFIIRPPTEPVETLPGLAVPVTFTIESWSDSDETIILEPSAPKGWTVEAPETRSLPAGETIEVEVEVTAPDGTPEGTAATIGLGGVTEGGEEGAEGRLPTVVGVRTGVELDLGEGDLMVRPGSAIDTQYMASREVLVRNTGNQPVEVSFHAQPNREGWIASTTPGTVELTPGSVTTLVVSVGAPEGALWGSTASVMVVVAVEDGPSLDVAYLRCSVSHSISYSLAFYPASTPLMNGQALVDLVLINDGNGFEDVTLDLIGVPVDWTAEIIGYGSFVRIAPGGTRTFPVSISAPEDAPPGEVMIAARMLGSDDYRSVSLTVNVLEAFTVDLEMEDETRTLTPPGTVVFPFRMTATGNAAGEARVSLEGLPQDWDYAFTTPEGVAAVSFPMDTGASANAQLSLLVPEDAEGETEVIDLVVRDHFGSLLVRMPIYVRLRLPDLAVTDVLVLPSDPREGAPLTVRATVVNLGMADAEDVSVVLKEGTTVIDRDTLSIVPRLGSAEVVLYMVPDSGRMTMVLEVDPANVIRERDEANNIVKRHIDVAAPPDEPLVSPAVAQASVAVVLTVSILGLLGGTESGKYAFLTLIFIPLYTKIKKDRVLDHYLRGKIHGYIIANPGEHYNAIKEQLNVTNGALSYHLRVLEREGYVRSRMDGIFKRFYPADMKLPTTQRNISSFQEVILTIVKNNQGLSQKDIAKRIGASSQVINYHIKILEESELIEVDRSRRKSKVYAIDSPATIVVTD